MRFAALVIFRKAEIKSVSENEFSNKNYLTDLQIKNPD